MKKILSGLLTAILLIALSCAVNAENLPDPDTTPDSGSDSSSQIVVIVPGEEDLPDGYVVDEDFIMEFEMNSESNWSRNLTEMLEQFAGDDYIYYFIEKEVPKGYKAYYMLDSTVFTDGNVIIIKNIREGEPPVYELPQTGGGGTTVYTVVGSAFLLAAAVYCMILYRRRKKALNPLA